MKNAIVVLSMSLISMSCSHKSVHQICSNPEEGRYKDYNQCYAEESAAQERKRERARQWRNNWSKPSTSCITSISGSIASTTCN